MLIKINGILILSLLLTACGGGDSTEESPVLPRLTVDSPAISEGNSGTSQLIFTATLDKKDVADVTVDYATANDTATANSDYAAVSGSVTIPAGDTSASIVVTLNGDTDVETDETFTLNLSNFSSNTSLLSSTATGTILNDDVASESPTASSSALNDTGVTTCSNGLVNGLDCKDAAVGTDQFPNQDGEHGRDVTSNDDSDGVAGFVFSKLDSNGTPLSDQSLAYAVMPWSCVKDEITGLTWEVKTDDDSLHDKDWTYSWFNSSGINDGGNPGRSNGGRCSTSLDCDTQKYMNAVNTEQFCSFDNWRLPTRHELISLLHFGASSEPYIDTAYFVNPAALPYWSSSPAADNNVAYVNYSQVGARTTNRNEPFVVRLVRKGE